MAIQCDRKIAAASKVYLQFALPDYEEEIHLSGKVVRIIGQDQIGVQFADLPQRSSQLLKQWLHRQLSRGAPPATARGLQVLGRPGESRSAIPPEAPRPDERRAQPRQACLLGAEVYRAGDAVPHRCSLRDISANGCYVETSMPLPVHTAIEIVVRTLDRKVKSRGVVQASHPGFGMGVRFTPANDQERAELMELVASLDSRQLTAAL